MDDAAATRMQRAGSRMCSATARGSRSSSSRRLAMLRGLRALRRSAAQTGLPLVAAGDVHMHARARRALQDTLTAIRLATPLAQCGYALHPNGERHLRSRGRLATIYPRALTDATLDVAERCAFSLDELRYEYPREIVPEGETPASWLRKLTEIGLARRYGGPSPQPSRFPRETRASRSSLPLARGEGASTALCKPPPCSLSTRKGGEGWGEGEGDMLRGDSTFRCQTAPPEVRELIEHELGPARRARATSRTSSPCRTSSRSRAARTSSARDAGRPRTRPSATRWASPKSIRRACRCCSSASSARSATSRRTSTWTSSTSGARK